MNSVGNVLVMISTPLVGPATVFVAVPPVWDGPRVVLRIWLVQPELVPSSFAVFSPRTRVVVGPLPPVRKHWVAI